LQSLPQLLSCTILVTRATARLELAVSLLETAYVRTGVFTNLPHLVRTGAAGGTLPCTACFLVIDAVSGALFLVCRFVLFLGADFFAGFAGGGVVSLSSAMPFRLAVFLVTLAVFSTLLALVSWPRIIWPLTSARSGPRRIVSPRFQERFLLFLLLMT
jgi:hypothetical protein